MIIELFIITFKCLIINIYFYLVCNNFTYCVLPLYCTFFSLKIFSASVITKSLPFYKQRYNLFLFNVLIISLRKYT